MLRAAHTGINGMGPGRELIIKGEVKGRGYSEHCRDHSLVPLDHSKPDFDVKTERIKEVTFLVVAIYDG